MYNPNDYITEEKKSIKKNNDVRGAAWLGVQKWEGRIITPLYNSMGHRVTGLSPSVDIDFG